MFYEVYLVKVRQIVIYIGSGRAGVRHKHTTSGVSHVYMLNKLHFTDPNSVEVHLIASNLSQERSLELELELIQHYEPIYNIAGSKHKNNKYIPIQYFEKDNKK